MLKRRRPLLGFYTVDFETLDEAIGFTKQLSAVNPGSTSYEIRPFYTFRAGRYSIMTDIAWIDLALASARPKALGALLRYFRNLDTAEEALSGGVPEGDPRHGRKRGRRAIRPRG